MDDTENLLEEVYELLSEGELSDEIEEFYNLAYEDLDLF